ncbi:unnamed protein product [Dibothriocephalus latus]|uniref:Uncharacterized protein n=1 Tax=Dibothriocephalus latus TaxID=60516 RepID=A0A3P7LYI6_DIBLA|nr:unnamed protein product [Dibothriocephalus latus]
MRLANNVCRIAQCYAKTGQADKAKEYAAKVLEFTETDEETKEYNEDGCYLLEVQITGWVLQEIEITEAKSHLKFCLSSPCSSSGKQNVATAICYYCIEIRFVRSPRPSAFISAQCSVAEFVMAD